MSYAELDERSFSPAVCLLRGELKESFSLPTIGIMLRRKSIGVLFVSMLLLISVAARIQKMRNISTGVWGGQHISMKVGAKSATIEYDCANGVIDGPLVVDADGHFNLRGTHRVERGGPVRENDNSKGQPATYTGTINGDTMTLTLKFDDAEAETFTLEKGKEGELFKCK
jgi:hypothetical protein